MDDSDSMPYTVTWDNGEFNSYNDSDLIAADVPTASEEDIPLELTLYVRSANSNGFSSYTYITLQEAMQKYETYLLRILGARRKRKSLSLPEWLHTVNIEKKERYMTIIHKILVWTIIEAYNKELEALDGVIPPDYLEEFLPKVAERAKEILNSLDDRQGIISWRTEDETIEGVPSTINSLPSVYYDWAALDNETNWSARHIIRQGGDEISE